MTADECFQGPAERTADRKEAGPARRQRWKALSRGYGGFTSALLYQTRVEVQLKGYGVLDVNLALINLIKKVILTKQDFLLHGNFRSQDLSH